MFCWSAIRVDIHAKLGLLPKKCNVLAVMQNEHWCGFYGSGRIPSRAGFITVSIRYSKVCMEECFGEDAETSTRAAYAPQTVSCRFLAISVRTPTFCRAFRNSDRLRARLR